MAQPSPSTEAVSAYLVKPLFAQRGPGPEVHIAWVNRRPRVPTSSGPRARVHQCVEYGFNLGNRTGDGAEGSRARVERLVGEALAIYDRGAQIVRAARREPDVHPDVLRRPATSSSADRFARRPVSLARALEAGGP